MSDSEFIDWFEAQYGKRPGPQRDDAEVRAQIAAAQHQLCGLESVMFARERWDEAKEAALYAWSAARTKR